MKKSIVFLLMLTSLLASCSDRKTVQLQEKKNPPTTDNNDQTKPTPSPGNPSRPEKPGEPGSPEDENGRNDDEVPSPPSNPVPSPSPSPGEGKVARIFCESQPIDARSFNTLRADVFSNYAMPSITSFVAGKPVIYVKSPTPLHSDGTKAFLILRAQEDFLSPWGIYKSTVDLYNTQSELQKMSSFSKPSKNPQFIYNQLKLENRILAANFKRTAYVYPDSKGSYVWENLKGGRFNLPFSAETAYSPQFVGGDDYIRFDQVHTGGQALTQKFYHFDSKKTLSLPSVADKKDSQLFGYINAAKNTVYWIEGRPGSAWKLRSMGLKSSSKAATLMTLPGNPRGLVLPMEMLPFGEETLLAYVEEDVDRNGNGQLYFKAARIHLLKADAGKGQVTGAKTVSYPQELIDLVKMETDFQQGLLRHLFYEPLSGKLFASNLPKGGLVSLNLRNEAWETHAMIGNVFGCLNPQWGPEVSHE